MIEFPLVSADEMAGEAWAAMARHDAEQALALWTRLRQHFPERQEGHILPIQLLWQAGRLDEADILASEASARFPANPEPLIQHAWIEMVRQRWDEALGWWAAARACAPERPEPYIWAARALWRSGRIEDAKRLAEDAARRFPDNLDARSECAWVASVRHEWSEALRLWTAVVECAPDRAEAHIGTIQALRMVDRADEAETMAQAAIARFPENIDLMVEYVWAAVERQDWYAAKKRLVAARDKTRDATRFADCFGEVERHLRSQADVPATTPEESPAEEGPMSPAELVLLFESLGARCDFGAVQRHYGVEPLGLLRFAYTDYDPLITAIEDRFAVVGTEEDTEFNFFNDEYILRMRKYGLIFHTFVYDRDLPTEESREAFRHQQRRRLAFLRDKLIADLEDPQKIYIYSTNDHAADSDAMRLHAALRRYGPNSLLYIRPATTDRSAGTVERLGDGLFAGYFSGLTDFVNGEQPPFELWRVLCEQTLRLVRQSAS
jgi:tetratricopeptide (TPR) repeat protein